MRIKNLKIGPIVSIVLLIMATFFFQPSSVRGASVVRTDKNIYNQGEMIKVIFSNSPGNDSDWICIVPAGSPDTEGGDYKYMPRGGLGQGSLIFDPRSPGKYEVRAYYNYRRNGYVVSGRYAFSVVSDPVKEETLAQHMEPMEPNNSVEANLPPPIPFFAPPEVVVIPETNVYVAPDIDADLFFWNGWWWRPWERRWYRSRNYNSGWGYYRNVPSFYRGIPSGWRNDYRDHRWGGHPWNYQRIPHQQLQRNWSNWGKSRHWEKQNTWGVQGLKPRTHSQQPPHAVRPKSHAKPQFREVQPQHSQPQRREAPQQSKPQHRKPERGGEGKQDRVNRQ